MKKRVRYVAIITLIMFALASFSTVGEKKEDELPKEVSNGKIKTSYEICSDENGNIILFEKSGNDKKVLRCEKAPPLRKNDIESLNEGINLESKEDALMLFEDFIS